jgi:pyrroline-5-carboxylate reductase
MNEKFGVKVTLSNTSLLDELKIIILSVKPNVMDEVLKEIAPEVTDEHLMISVAAGYPISKMENFLGTDKRIVRVMPNTPSKIGAGASGFCLG